MCGVGGDFLLAQMTEKNIVLRAGRERSIQKWHPWIFSGAIVSAECRSGDIVDVLDHQKNWLARGYFHEKTNIACRVLTFDQKESIDADFFTKRLKEALQRRQFFLAKTNGFRLVFGEVDMLPGLVVDIFDRSAVIQISTLGMDRCRELIVEVLPKVLDIECIYEKSDNESREVEGLSPQIGLLWGKLPSSVTITDHGAKFLVDIDHGQKTGFFLDQRENRLSAAQYAKGKTVLNTFSYTGAFAIHAALAGAKRVVSVDSSKEAVSLGKKNAALNNVESICQWEVEDVFEYLKLTDERFDVIILDPPGFVKSKRDITAGTNAYRVLHQLALKRLTKNGVLITSSCSTWVDRLLFHKIAFWACEKEGHQLRLIEERGHTWDHPISVFFPEGEYLKFSVYQSS